MHEGTLRAIDGNGHVPGEPPADRLLTAILETRELVYQMAEHIGITRDELNQRAGVVAS